MILKRQVSTEWKRVLEFLEEVRNRSIPEGGFVAIVEVCGFNDWLLKLLAEFSCRETVLVQPEKRTKNKTDRRDADALGELLWTNRQRLLAFGARCGRPSIDGRAAAAGPFADADDQPGAAPAAETQFAAGIAAGMPDEGTANTRRTEMACQTAAGDHRPLGAGSAPAPMGTVGQAGGRTRHEDPRRAAASPASSWPRWSCMSCVATSG